MSVTGWALAASFALLIANAFFVAASFALVSARRSQVESLVAGGSRRARRALEAMDRLAQLMAGAQLGITVCSVGLGALAEPALADLLDGPARAAGLPEGAVHPVAFSVALLIVVFTHVLFGEMVPKNLTLAVPDRAVVALAPALAGFSRGLGPALVAIRGAANLVLRMLRIRPPTGADHVFGLPEVAAMAAESHREGLLDDEEYRLMAGVLDFTAARAKDLAIPLSRLHCLPFGADAAQLETLAVQTRHMRFPVVDANGAPVGYVHAKDLLHLRLGGPNEPAPVPAVRPMPLLPAETPLPEALTKLREARAPMAVIGTAARPIGVLTLDDIVVALVRSTPPGSALSP
jgi:magnesium and cobalt exporter, CNNM family